MTSITFFKFQLDVPTKTRVSLTNNDFDVKLIVFNAEGEVWL